MFSYAENDTAHSGDQEVITPTQLTSQFPAAFMPWVLASFLSLPPYQLLTLYHLFTQPYPQWKSKVAVILSSIQLHPLILDSHAKLSMRSWELIQLSNDSFEIIHANPHNSALHLLWERTDWYFLLSKKLPLLPSWMAAVNLTMIWGITWPSVFMLEKSVLFKLKWKQLWSVLNWTPKVCFVGLNITWR